MKRIPYLFIISVILMVSCSDETVVYQDLDTNLSLETNPIKLKKSVIFENVQLIDILVEDKTTGKYSKSSQLSAEYPLNLVAQVQAPRVGGQEPLTATHVAVEGNFVYASYNTPGESYSGVVDAIKIDELRQPELISRMYFETADINALTYDNGYVYAVGGFDSEKDITVEVNSVIAKIPVNSGVFDIQNVTYAYQEGFNATDVKIHGNNVIVVSGGMGGVASYNKQDLVLQNYSSYDDLRSIAVNNSNIAVLNASSGVKVLDHSLEVVREFNVSMDFGDFAKRTIDFANGNIVISGGSEGAGVYEVSSGNLLQTIPIPIRPEGVQDINIVTNAVANNEDLLFMANGGAGLSLSEDRNGVLESVGIIDIEGSINFVASKGDYVFAASGTEGVQIIKINKPTEDMNLACSGLANYSGTDVIVQADQEVNYNVRKYFNNVENNGQLLMCGWFVSNNNIEINDGALMESNGRFWVRKDVIINKGAKLRVKGPYIVLYGDLILNDGATLEFVDNPTAVYLLGRVIRNGEVQINGSFNDVYNKF